MAQNKKGGQIRLRRYEVALFCTQISVFLRSGITLFEGISLLEEDLEPCPLKTVVSQIHESVSRYIPFADALSATEAFPDYLIQMVSIGEISGNLEEILSELARYYEREDALRRRVRRSVTNPLIMIGMMTAVIILLLVAVLPMFEDILRSVGGEMPGIVKGLMAFGNFLGNNALYILLIIALLTAAFLIYRKTEGGRDRIDRIKAVFPLTRGLTRKIAAERFATAMSFLLRSNVDVQISLDLSRSILGNSYMSAKIDDCKERVAEGMSIYDALYVAGIFPKLFTRMLGIGFKTGNLDSMMTRLSEIYEQEVNDSLRKITAAIEPTFVAILSVIVGIILVAVMLPLINIMTAIG